MQQLQNLLLKHLLSSHIPLRTLRSMPAPADALQIGGCSSCIVIEQARSFTHSNPPAPTPSFLPALTPSLSLLAGLTSHRSSPVSINSNEAGSSFPTFPAGIATPKWRWAGPHGTDWRMGGRIDRKTGAQTDMQPCDFSVILESILSNFAICLGGSDGSVELICRLLALLRLYRTSFWSGMQARVCGPLELRGLSMRAPCSHHSIIAEAWRRLTDPSAVQSGLVAEMEQREYDSSCWCSTFSGRVFASHSVRNWVQFAGNGHTHTCTRAHVRITVTHCGSRLVQLLLGSDINTEQIGWDLQPLLFDLSSSCHISWHCPPATPRGAGRTGMASTCLPGLFSVFFPVQLIPLCLLHGFSSANYKSSPTPSDRLDSRDLQSTSLSPSERSDATTACDVSLTSLFSIMTGLCSKLGHLPHSPLQV